MMTSETYEREEYKPQVRSGWEERNSEKKGLKGYFLKNRVKTSDI